ncbi:hypothetical protein MNBD_GAMMA08-1553 [hydrothermal vent metagenome]|uniref:Uncharacterized protein n=1 Tax=hydrothermal vent metagenome TaxID=652676 RepID=A0A3B0WU31_9ZZZZ
MHPLNELRLNAGIVIDPALEITKPKEQITEARDAPRRKSDLKSSDTKTLKSKVRGCVQACNHINQAIEVLSTVPSTDFGGEVPRFIQELEDLMDAGGDSGMEAYLEQCTCGLRKAEGIDKEAKRRADDEEALAELEAAKAEEEFEREVESDRIAADEYKAEVSSKADKSMRTEDEDELGSFIKALSPDQQKQIKVALDALNSIATGVVSEGNVEKNALDIMESFFGEHVSEAMHYYGAQYKGSHEEAGDKPINVSDGNANGEQVMDTLPPTKNESPEQLKTGENGKPEDNKTHDDINSPIRVPNGIKQSLRTEIQKAKKEAESQDTRNKEASYFYNDLAKAFEDLLGHLEGGTRNDMKQAQIFAQTLMGPMLHKIPTDVWKFITNGGETRSLKSYMSPVDKKYAGMTTAKK